jgi:aminocarboxymuconate-semialdehyde decarboxylase
MSNRRQFLKEFGGAAAGALLLGGMPLASARPQAARRQVTIGGRRIKTVDVHAHVNVPGIADFLRDTPLARAGGGGGVDVPIGPERIAKMDAMGIDVQALSINAFWYGTDDEDLVRRLMAFQNQKLAELCAAYPDRFVAFAAVGLQFPELAAQQLEEGMKRWKLRGAAIGGSIYGQELSAAKFDPFWKKAEELQALVFMHPQDSVNATGVNKRVSGSGVLGNVIGNPLETTFFLSHLIFEGTLDKFPNLRLCCAHGGGYLPSYIDRSDHGCLTFPQQCSVRLKKKPSEYLRQIYIDSLVFSPEALRHLVAVSGPGQIMVGTDYPFPWTSTPVDHVMNTPGLSDADRAAILGGTACKLLGIPA